MRNTKLTTATLTIFLGMAGQYASASGSGNGVLDTINKTSSAVQGAANSTRQATTAAKSVNTVAKGTTTSTPAKPAAAAASATASTPNAMPAEGANLMLKLDKVKLLEAPKPDAATVATLSKKDGVVYMGTATGPFLKVSTDQGEGWIDKHLIK